MPAVTVLGAGKKGEEVAPAEIESGSLLVDGEMKQNADFHHSFFQELIAWRFSLLLLCNCLLFWTVLGVYSGMSELLSSKVSRSQSGTAPDVIAATAQPATTATMATTAISPTALSRPSRPSALLLSGSSRTSAGRRDPSTIPNATLSSTPWVVHRFAKAGISPHMCLQCLMIGKLSTGLLKVLELQIEYARRHGYDLYTYTDDSEQGSDGSHAVHFWKMRSTQYLIESGTTGCDYIFWMDSDAIIMNMSFPLESLIHWDGMEDTDIVVAADTLAVNLAQSLWKFSRFSYQILEDSWNIGGVVPLVETGAFNAILGGCQPDHSPQEKVACYKHMDVGWKNRTFAREYFYPGDNRKIKELVVNKSLLPHIKWVPKRAINSFPFGLIGGRHRWGDPDFIVHCPGNKGKAMFLPNYIERGLLNAGLRPDPAADARRDPSAVANATSATRPWVIHRFARPGASPHICLQSRWIEGHRHKENQLKMQAMRIHYAKLHGYDLYSLASEPTRPRFSRRESTQLLIERKTGCDYIFWLSVDAIVVDINFKIESLITWQGASDTDLIVAGNLAVVNLVTGLWKSSSFNSLLLQDLLEIVPGSEGSATASMSALLGGCTVKSNEEDKTICQAKVTKVGQSKRSPDPIAEAIQSGDSAYLGELVMNKSLLPHMKWVPKRLIGARPQELGFDGNSDSDYNEKVQGVFLVYCGGIRGRRYIPKILPTALKNAGLSPKT